MNPSLRVLFVEDNQMLCENLAEFFTEPDYKSDFAQDGLVALQLLGKHNYDIIVLDVNLPGVQGTLLCQHLREQLKITTPVIFLTAMDSLDDKLLGFKSGGDDYLTKPFDLRELAVRMEAIARRMSARDDNTLVRGPITYFPGRLLVEHAGKSCQLAGLGAHIFELFMRRHPNYVSFQDLAEQVWQNEEVDDNTIRTQIYILRKLLDKHLGPGLIKTVHGLGYRLAL